MTRNSRARPGLTESWDDVDDSYDDDGRIYSEDDEKAEMKDSYKSDRTLRSSTTPEDQTTRARRGMRPDENQRQRQGHTQTTIPDLVMPKSPNGLRARTKNDLRASTPHFRLNERSMTSDAGKMNAPATAKMRASTPHIRANQRSFTSDAGQFGSRLRGQVQDEVEDDGSSLATAVWQRVVRPALTYLGDIVGLALQNAKPLFGYALLVYAIIGALVFGGGFLSNSINNALSPICRIPGSSYLHLPFCPTGTSLELQGPAEFDRLVQAQSQFEDVLASTQVGATLPMDMKRSEASIRDLKHVVQYSTLPSKQELVFEFSGFIDTARQASQDLGRFNSRIGRAVDHILSTNRWTLSVIDGVSASEAGRGSLARWANNNSNIFAPFQPVSLSRDVLLDQYLRHTGAVEEQVLTLIEEAQALLNILDNLDGRLDVIASIAMRDGIKAQDNKEQLFATLWTKLGGNRSSVSKVNKQIDLLTDVGQYRRLAWAHVTTTIVKLQAIRDNLEDLRERVAMPEILGDKVPLEVHISSINLGIDRLEQQRDSSKRLEAEGYARILAKADVGDRRSIGEKDL